MNPSPRVASPDRQQLQLRSCHLDSVIAEDHPARLIWIFLERVDLSSFYDCIRARGSEPGRPATDPRVLLCLWIFATKEGVGSARRLERLCSEHDAYRWICGGVSVNYHGLSDFRVGHERELDELMTRILGVLLKEGLVELTRVAQDGIKVRASAGAASFRREKSLEECCEEARRQVEAAKKEAEEPDPQQTARKRAASQRAAEERLDRIERALRELPKARAVKPTAKEKEGARVSTTDPEARVMKMADGGYRPGWNVQLATDTKTRVIVGVTVDNAGSDMGHLGPMVDEIEHRVGRLPDEALVDGGYTKLADITAVENKGVAVYAPVPKPRVEGVDPFQPKADDTAEVAAWRKRMGTENAKGIYKDRASTAETVNADLRAWRGWKEFRVRGREKVACVALLGAITYNVLRALSLGLR